MHQKFTAWLRMADDWLFQPRHRAWCHKHYTTARRAFTTHPQEGGESYLQHLWFTVCMSARFIYVTIVLFLHGVFPFIFIRTASSQIEIVYRIMKSRIPKTRRDEIDTDYHV